MYRLVVLFVLVAAVASGQTVSSVTGTMSHGSSITISGSGFGIKSPAAPLVYENFQDGVVGGPLKDQASGGFSTSSTYAADLPEYSNAMGRFVGDVCSLQKYDGNSYRSALGIYGVDFSKMYFSGWVYREDFDGTAGYCENAKMGVNLYRSDADLYPQQRYDSYFVNSTGPADRGHLYTMITSGQKSAEVYAGGRAYWNEWWRHERWSDMGDVGVANGEAWYSHNGERFAEISGVFWDDAAQPYNNIEIAHYFRKGHDDYPSAGYPTPSCRIYYSEIYVDVTQARVEIGNNPVFASCTHREIQIPSAWSSTSVTATVNTGTFAAGESVYVFVVDASGTASAGYPVTIDGESGNPSAPGRPQNMSAVER